jgi:hypothetical protein
VGGLIRTEIDAIGSVIGTIRPAKDVPAVPAFLADDVRTNRDPIAHFQRDAICIKIGSVDLFDMAYDFMTFHAGKDPSLLSLGTGIKDHFSFIGMLIRPADPRHFDLDDHGVLFNLRVRKFLNLDLSGF